MAEFKPIPTDPKFKGRTGQQFGVFQVLGYMGKKCGVHRWLCRCRCGKEWEVDGKWIPRGDSCGCTRTRGLPRGLYRTTEWSIWKGMNRRCHYAKHPHYNNYGGRGIFVCERWRFSLENFISDMGMRPTKQHTLDRIDNDGPYCPENCRWATRIEQSRNRRDNHVIELNGRKMILADWCIEFGISSGAVLRRLGRGWSYEDALTIPLKKAT